MCFLQADMLLTHNLRINFNDEMIGIYNLATPFFAFLIKIIL